MTAKAPSQHWRAAVERGRQFLSAAQAADGGWPYRPGTAPSLEPACYALAAMDGAASAQQRDAGLRWLLARQAADGAFTLPGDNEPHWAAPLAMLALAHLGAAEPQRAAAVRWLLTWAGRTRPQHAALTLDGQLVGWPWTGDAFSWVEPTAYALLALKRSGQHGHPRVAEGEKMLLDRQCSDGGWNYGNPAVFGTALPGFIPTTSLATLALRDSSAAGDATRRGLDFLQREIQNHRSALALSLAILCLAAFGRPTEELAATLAQRQQGDGSWRQDVRLTALAVLALQAAAGSINLFKLDDAPPR
ncbi:MAG: hypothetical protein HZA91_14745 [Verrucomicrobia bacterium]|nr:hypothetical protein [Verrucomicrobiota bacterium]